MKHKGWNAEFKKLVKSAITDYTETLGFKHYAVDVRWFDQDDTGERGGSLLAACTTDHRYLTATVKIYPCFEKRWISDGKHLYFIRETISHEIAHIATHSLWYIATSIYKDEGESVDAWESLTTVVGRLLYDIDKLKNKPVDKKKKSKNKRYH